MYTEPRQRPPVGLRSTIKSILPNSVVEYLRESRSSVAERQDVYRTDLANKLRYGPRAPLKYQMLYCETHAISLFHRYVTPLPDALSLIPAGMIIPPSEIEPVCTKFIAAGDWDRNVVPLFENRTVQRTLRKLETSCSWEESGEIPRMRAVIRLQGYVDHYRTEQDLVERYRALDAMVCTIRREGRLKERRELSSHPFREQGGPKVYVARDGSFIKSSDGLHRIAAALHFGVEAIPLCLEAVHEECVTSGLFQELVARSNALRERTLRS